MSGGSEGGRSQWWLDPALAQLAFGRSTHASRTWRPPLDSDSPFGDMGDRPMRIDLDDPLQREFGDYELLELIGQGGMGMVYRARQHGLDREVAIKLLSAGALASVEFVAGFRREARHAAQLQHPNIVVVHEMGEHAGQVFYAMQLVRGRSLSQLLTADETLSPHAAARLLRTIAEAVDYAHRLGVLHLDLKPGNLLIDEHGVPLVADFGLARRIEQAIGVDNEHVSGTPSYMAPEQALVHGPPLSPATDVWGLGAILYELLTGTPPFEAGDPEATLRQLTEGEVRKPSQLKIVPADLEAICLMCLARDPQQRYPTARALADDLGRFLEGRSVSVRALSAPQRIGRWARREPRLATVGALAVVALLAGMLATSLQWQRAEANASQAGHALWSQRALAMQQAYALGRDYTALPGLAANLLASETAGDSAGIARERKRLGFTFAAYPRLIDRFHLPQRVASLALSPDGRRLAIGTLESSEVLLFDTADGRQLWRVSLAAEPAFFGQGSFSREMRRLHFSPDGRYLIVGNWWPTPVVSPSGIDNWRIDVATGVPARPQQRFADLLSATYSTDGRHALLRRLNSQGQAVQLWDAEAWKPISGLGQSGPEGSAWLIAAGAKFIARWDGDKVDIVDPSTLQVRHGAPNPEPGTSYTAWDAAPDARWLALGDKQGAVVLVDAASGAQRRLLPGPAAWVHWLQFSADGDWLVAASEDGSAWLWQRADGYTHGRRIHVGVPLWNAAADPHTGLVRTGGADSVSVWQLSGLGEADRAAQPRAPLFQHAQQISRYASDLHAASGLLATASDDGEVRLWRLPGTPIRPRAAAPQMTSQLAFDGLHLVAVEDRKVTVVRAEDDRPVSRDFVHPQPIGFAALSADGDTLVTSSGRELRAFDWRRGRLRFPPLALPNSPLKLAIDPQGRRLYASYTVERGRALTEGVAAFSLVDGRALAAPVEIPDGLSRLVPTPDGDRLLLMTAAAVEIRDGATLRLVGKALRQADTEVIAIAASRSPARIAIAASPPEAGMRLYDLASARWLPAVATLEPPMSVAMSANGTLRVALLPQNHAIELIRDNGTRQRINAPNGTQFARAAAFSADDKVLAQALIDGVLLLDAASGEWLAPPLRVPIAAPDVVTQLAFSADGARLLARTHFGRWLWWRLDPDVRDNALIAQEAQLLSPAQQLSTAATASLEERRALRRLDPGPIQIAAPQFPASSCLTPAPPPLPRDPSTSARLLDLVPHAAFNPRRHSTLPTTLLIANLCGLPLGVQRFDGVDFDVRAAVTPGAHKAALYQPQRSAREPPGILIATGIPIPAAVARIAALELLATSVTFVQVPPPESLPVQANVVLHYVDGSTARMPLRYGRDHTMWTEALPATSHLGWQTGLPRAETGLQMSPSVHLFRVRIPNPFPERAVLSLDIEAMRVTWNGIAVLAITLDPAMTPKRVAAETRRTTPEPVRQTGFESAFELDRRGR